MKPSYRWPFLLSVALAVGLALGLWLGDRGVTLDFSSRGIALKKWREVLRTIDQEYVDPIDVDSLVDVALSDVMGRLDPHSVYLPREEAKALEEELSGSYEGIGIEYRMIRDTMAIVSVRGPASRVRLRAGDRILSVDGKTIVQWPSDSITRLLKGKAGTPVALTYVRRGLSQPKKVVLKRASISIPSIEVTRLDSGRIGYLRILRFGEHTTEEVEKALTLFSKRNLHGLVLDLRGNGGGFLWAGEQVADAFLSAGKTIVITVNRQGEKYRTLSTAGGAYEKGKLIVLVDAETASAAEIVTAALQENGRAVVWGQRTYGKGLVQDERVLSDGSRLRLTTSRYLTPRGHSIQRPYKPMDPATTSSPSGGIVPDVALPLDTFWVQNRWLAAFPVLETMESLAFVWADTDRATENSPSTASTATISDDRLWQFLETVGLGAYIDRLDESVTERLREELRCLYVRQLFHHQAYVEETLHSDAAIQSVVAHWAK